MTTIDLTNWTALVDDDGSNLVGSLIDKAKIASVVLTPAQAAVTALDAVDASRLPGTSYPTTAGTVTALALPTGTGDLVLFVNNATLLTVQGIVAGTAGQRLAVISIGAGQVEFAHQNGSATAANRLINFVTSGITPLAAGVGSAVFVYDATAARWRMTAHEQGAWILRTFAAGNYTASGTMTWTVASGDVFNDSYYLKGRHLSFDFDIATSTVGGTLSTDLKITLPNSWTSPSTGSVLVTRGAMTRIIDNNGTPVSGQAYVDTTTVNCRTMTGGNWLASTDLTFVQGQIMVMLT